MVIDYSKWDNLELSDDSDIEVHPNVDKKSFIRWKQRDIHEKRHVRSQEKDQLRFEMEMNGKLLARIDRILDAIKAHTPSASDAGNPNAADEFVLKTMFATTSEVDKQRATGAPDNAPTYGQMITKLADKVAGEIPKGTDKFEGFKNGFQKHRDELEASNEKSRRKLEEMEKEDSKKITSDGLRTGFDSTHITKASEAPAPAPAAESSSSKPKKKKIAKTKVQQVEVLNPKAVQKPAGTVSDSISSGAEADVEEGEGEEADEEDEDEDMKVSELGKKFAKLKVGDYRAYAEFISKNPTVLAEKETDGLLIEAFNSQLDGKDDYARQCVHQALLLQYCRQLGRDGVALFFKRITTPNHQAQKVFQDDVNQTYNRIRTRAKEINAERAADASGGAEQIQLHAVDPNTQITIGIPPENSDDPVEQESRRIFETLPPGLRRALESGSLDEVNTVLGKMAVEEAEEVVGKLSAGGMLSLEESIIDATTEEGKAKLAEIEKGEQDTKGKGKAVSTTELE